MQYGQEALEILQALYGPEDLHVAVAQVNLALFLAPIGETDRAESLLHAALDMRTRLLGPEHRDIGHVYHNLALLYRNTGRWAQAESAYERALDIWVQQRAVNEWMATQRDLAEMWRMRGDRTAALAAYDKLLHFALAASTPDNNLHAYFAAERAKCEAYFSAGH